MKLIKANWEDKKITTEVDKLVSGYDDGELFVEEVYSENILLDDNRIKSASYDNDKGFGLRAVNEDKIKFYHSSQLNETSFNKALKSLSNGGNKSQPEKNYIKTNSQLLHKFQPTQLNLT